MARGLGGRGYEARSLGAPFSRVTNPQQRSDTLVKSRPCPARARLRQLVGATGVPARPGKASYWHESERRPPLSLRRRTAVVQLQRTDPFSPSIQIPTLQNTLQGGFADGKAPRTSAVAAANATFEHELC